MWLRDMQPKRQSHRPRSPHPNYLTIHANTDALARLAWTGEFLSPSNDVSRSVDDAFLRPRAELGRHSSWRSTWSSPEDDSEEFNQSPLELALESPIDPVSLRPILFRRCPSPNRRKCKRWTLSLAIADEELTDEALIDEFEKMRRRSRIWEWEWRRNPDSPSSPPYDCSTHGHVESSTGENISTYHIPRQPSLPDIPLNSRWKTARHALLICRELVRTERHYLSSLRTLRSKETLTMPPALMVSYLPALIQSSEVFLSRLEQNPSAKGVAEAFIADKTTIEQGLVSWCGVVGSFFIGAEGNEVKVDRAGCDEGTGLKRRVGSWGKKVKSLSSNSHPAGNIASGSSVRNNGKHKPRVRDLAILPSQRAVRYVLLYKGLDLICACLS